MDSQTVEGYALDIAFYGKKLAAAARAHDADAAQACLLDISSFAADIAAQLDSVERLAY